MKLFTKLESVSRSCKSHRSKTANIRILPGAGGAVIITPEVCEYVLSELVAG